MLLMSFAFELKHLLDSLMCKELNLEFLFVKLMKN
jgi:hypothetical protein